jgi:hypothetical protein
VEKMERTRKGQKGNQVFLIALYFMRLIQQRKRGPAKLIRRENACNTQSNGGNALVQTARVHPLGMSVAMPVTTEL